MRKYHIVVVDDEPDLRSAVSRYLVKSEFQVTEAADGQALRSLISETAIDLVILDINMPGEDGLSLARFLSERGNIAIIMLTGNADPVDKILGLELGADDYIPKPFNMRELLARVRAVLRRSAKEADAALLPLGTVAVGRCKYDSDGRRLFDQQGMVVQLSPREADLLHLLICRPGEVITRDDVLDMTDEPETEPFSRSIDARIRRLRKKVEIDPARPRAIRTVHGQGYMFVEPKDN